MAQDWTRIEGMIIGHDLDPSVVAGELKDRSILAQLEWFPSSPLGREDQQLAARAGHEVGAARIPGRSLRARGAAVVDTIWGADVTLRIAIDPGDRDSIDACLAQASSGVAKFRYVETRRIELDEAPSVG